MMNAASLLYEPLNEYKPLGPDIGIVDGPLEYFTTAGVRLPLPFSTRMTVVRLKNRDLFLHSPVVFEASLAGRLQSMGRIRHLASPNQFHYAHIGEWSRAFPDAVTWASPGVRARARARSIDVQFKRDLGVEAPDEWRDEIEQTVVPGGIFGEIIFFHKLSKTIIMTDTILNLELDKLRQPWRFAAWLTGMHYPNGQLFLGCDYRSCCRGEGRERRPRRCFHGGPNASFLATDAALRRAARRYCDGSSRKAWEVAQRTVAVRRASPPDLSRIGKAEPWIAGVW
jgi:hypothetical protein